MQNLGDLASKVSLAIYGELEGLLTKMESQDAQLRTEKMKNFLYKSKKRLTMLYVFSKWLTSPSVQLYIAKISTAKMQISDLDTRIERLRDGLFYSHRDLYSHRVIALDPSASLDIIRYKTYRKLPTSMFKMEADTTIETHAGSLSSFMRGLNIFIRAKLILVGKLPISFDNSTVENGRIIFSLSPLFSLTLTLHHMDESSPWDVLDVSLLMGSAPNECLDGGCNLSPLSASLKEALQRIALTEDVKVDGSSTSVNSPAEIMLKMFNACAHASYSIALRYLYVQASDTYRSNVSNGRSQLSQQRLPTSTSLHDLSAQDSVTGVGFQVNATCCRVHYQFWHASTIYDGAPQYELRLIQDRKVNPNWVNSANIRMQLIDVHKRLIVKDLSSGPTKDATVNIADNEDSYPPFFVSSFPQLMDLNGLLREHQGACFSKVLCGTLAHCARGRVHFLRSILKHLLDELAIAWTANASALSPMEPVLTLMHDSTSVRLSITGTSAGSMPVKVHITFSVDRYSGLYTLFSNDLEILGAAGAKCCERLQAEINSEEFISNSSNYFLSLSPDVHNTCNAHGGSKRQRVLDVAEEGSSPVMPFMELESLSGVYRCMLLCAILSTQSISTTVCESTQFTDELMALLKAASMALSSVEQNEKGATWMIDPEALAECSSCSWYSSSNPDPPEDAAAMYTCQLNVLCLDKTFSLHQWALVVSRPACRHSLKSLRIMSFQKSYQ